MNRRKNYFIKKRFQTDFLIRFIVLLFVEAALIAALFMFGASGTFTTVYQGSELTIQNTASYFLFNFILITLIVGGAIGIAGFFVFMYLTHRIGGPLYKFEKTFEEIKNGDVSQRMRLRETDQLLELRDKVNLSIEEIDNRISMAKKRVEEGVAFAGKCPDSADMERIREILQEIRSSIEYFKTSI